MRKRSEVPESIFIVCVCLDVNQDDTNCNRCTQKLVILRAQTC